MSQKRIRSFEEMCINESTDEVAHREELSAVQTIFLEQYKQWLKCTKCAVDYARKISLGKNIEVHPLLKVFFCKKCKDFYGDGEFSMDEGEDKYCRWCGEGGTLYLCSDCVHGFCPQCIKKNLGPEVLADVENDDNWKCFFCQPKPLWFLRYVTTEGLKLAEENRYKDISTDNDSLSSKRSSIKRRISSSSEDFCETKRGRKKKKKNNKSDQSSDLEKEVAVIEDKESDNGEACGGETLQVADDDKEVELMSDSGSPKLVIAETSAEQTSPNADGKRDRDENGVKEAKKKNGHPNPASNLRKLYHSCGLMGYILAKKLKKRISALTPDTLDQCRQQIKDMTDKLKPLALELQRKLNDVVIEESC